MRTQSFTRRMVIMAAFLAAFLLAPVSSFAGIFISVGFAPPVLPVYAQPVCPGDGYLWNPGYWAYGPEGYYWVPGVWVQPPTYGVLWTPPYWAFEGGAYGFHPGYWGPHVGFYGGVNYGFGFFGSGFYGGRWEGDRFRYNTAVNNVNVTVIHNTYVDRTVIRNVNVTNNRVSFNGGPNGIQARPNAQEAAFTRENHIPPTAVQQSHFEAAHANPANFARTNGGNPQFAALPRVGATQGAVPARGAVVARESNQQQRIANGVSSGQLNARETGRLENREANINQTARGDRQANGGALTTQQRENLNQRQNNVSGSIYQDRHNGVTQPTPRAGFGGQGQAQGQGQWQGQARQPVQPQARPVQPQARPVQPQAAGQQQRVQTPPRAEARPQPREESRPREEGRSEGEHRR